MSPFIANLTTRLFDFSRAGRSHVARVAPLILLHLVALAIQIGTETRLVSQLAFVLSWVFYNFFWIVLLRRPTVAAAMALTFLALLILLSQFKHHVLLMTVNFVDLMMIDADTLAFLMQVFPHLDAKAALAACIVLLALAAVWRFDTVRMGRYVTLLGATASLACLVGVSLAVPSDPWEESYNEWTG